MRSRSGSFKQLRHFAAFGTLCLSAAACAAAPSPRLHAAPAQPLAHMMVATPDGDHDLVAQLMAGEMALTHSDLKAAAVAYGKASALSDDPKVSARAAELALAVHDSARAQAAIARWQKLGAGPADLAKARAQLALDQGDAAQARQQLEQLVDSANVDGWPQFGRVLIGARDQAQAVRLLEAIATPERLPADPQAWMAMSELGERFGRPAYALRIADAAAQHFKTAQTYAWAAQMHFKADEHPQGRALMRQAVGKAPDDIKLRLAYASMLAQDHDYAEAAKWLAKGPQNTRTFELRAALAAHTHDTRTLAALYRQLQQAPASEREESVFLLGQLAEMQGLRDEALNWYDQVGDEDPHAFDADLRSAVILHAQDKPAEAHALLGKLEAAYRDQPDQLHQAYQADAALYMVDKAYVKAQTAFSRALQVVPHDPGLLYGRGLAYAEGGKIDQAVADLRHLLKLKPDDVDASNALGFTLADANRELPEATRLLTIAREARPDDPAIADSWGWLQYRLGHFDQAVQVLRGAWAARKDTDVGVHLGEALWKQGDRAGARTVFDQVRKLDPDNAGLRDALKRLQP